MESNGSLKSAILKVASTRTMEKVSIPQFGQDVWIRGMTGAERDAFEASVALRKKNGDVVANIKNVRARLLVLVMADKDGNLIFTPEEANELGKLPASILSRLFEIAQKLSGFGDADMEELAAGLGEELSVGSGSV